MLLCYNFIKKCKPGEAGAATEESEAGRTEARIRGTLGSWPPVGPNWLLQFPGLCPRRLYNLSVSGHSTKRWKGEAAIYNTSSSLPSSKIHLTGTSVCCTSTVHVGRHWENSTAPNTSALSRLRAVGERCVAVGAWGCSESHQWPGLGLKGLERSEGKRIWEISSMCLIHQLK